MQKRCLSKYVLFFTALLILCAYTEVFAQQRSSSENPKPATATVLIGEHIGIEEIDAQSAAMLIATEFRKLGVPVDDPVGRTRTSGTVYRITFNRLGQKILVKLSQEMPLGTVLDEKQLWIDNIEEVIKAAPRLVDALVNDKEIEQVIDMETVTSHEAAELNKKPGESLWNMGIFGAFIPGTDATANPGYEFGWSYETPKYGVGTEFRLSAKEYEYMFASWSIGGRYFFNANNVSPYVGGGLSIFGGSYEDSYYYDDYDYFNGYYYEDDESGENSGLGAYFVGGISMLRLTKSRLKLEIRIDRPFFSLPEDDMMPITFGIFFSQHYVPGRGCLSF